MANDSKYRIIIEGEDADALAKINRVIKGINDTKKAVTKYQRERQMLAREERKDRFQALSDEEKRARLTMRQIDLERKLARARMQGNLSRISALELSVARNRSTQRGLGGGGGDGAGLLGLASRGLGALGIGASVAGVAHALTKVVSSSLRFADEIGDLSEQAGLTRIQMLKIQKAAGAAGVSQGAALSGINAFAGFRSSVLAGDEKALGIASKFGMLGRLMGPEDNVSAMLGIRQAIGPGGVTSENRNDLGSIFGGKPGRMVSLLGAYGQSSIGDEKALDQKLQNLDAVNAKFEDAMLKWKLIMVNATDAVINITQGIGRGYMSVARPVQNFWDRTGMASNSFDDGDPTPLPLSAGAQARRDARISRTGFSSSSSMINGSSIQAKQLQTLQELSRTAKETKTLLEGNTQ